MVPNGHSETPRGNAAEHPVATGTPLDPSTGHALGGGQPQTDPDDSQAFEDRVRAIVVGHFATLLEENLFLVASSLGRSEVSLGSSDAPGSVAPSPVTPTVLALDTQGRQVIIDVARVLDEAALLAAMALAGHSANLTRAHLADRYPSGPSDFQRDLAAFYGSIPVSPTTANSAGTRLVIVCGEIHMAVRPALQFLREAGNVVEVIPLTWKTVERVAHQVRMSKEPAAPEPVAPEPTVDEPSEPATSANESSTDTSSIPLPTPTKVAPSALPEAGTQEAVEAPESTLLREHHPISTHHHTPHPEPIQRPVFGSRLAEPLAITNQIALGGSPLARPLPRTQIPRRNSQNQAARPLAERTAALQAAVTGIPAVDLVKGETPEQIFRDLRVLCAEIGSPATLVWVRERRGERHEALLHPSGVIELGNGTRYRNPSKAAMAATGNLGQVDGWAVWRFGEKGPTLAEAWTELYGDE